MADEYVNVSEVKKIGVARVSTGPRPQIVAAKAMQKDIEESLSTSWDL